MAVDGAYTRVAGGRSGISKVMAPCNIDLYGVSCEADFYESLCDLYSFMFPSKFTSTCLVPAEHAELGQMLGTRSDGVFSYRDVMLEQYVGLDVMLEVSGRYGSKISPRNDNVFPSCNQGVMLEQEVPGRDDSSISPNVELQPGLKSPSSLSAWLSNMPTPQHVVYISAIWSDPNNIKSVNNVTETSVHCRSLTFVTPRSKTTTINPYHKYKPNYKSGRHWSAGKDASTFDICMAAKMALYRTTHSLIDAFMKTGDPEQQRHPLLKFLTHKRIIDDWFSS
jgi:hypothetical protein